jgi:hypothetical protein
VSERDRKVLVMMVGAVVLVASVGALVEINTLLSQELSGSPGPPVQVTGVAWGIVYHGSQTGYFGSSEVNGCLPCPPNGNGGSWYTATVYLVNNGSEDHTITNVTVALPFVGFNGVPGVPAVVAPGHSVAVQLYVEYPSKGGAYELRGTVDTS